MGQSDGSRKSAASGVIDATIPLGEWQEFERKQAPRQGKLRLEDFL